MATGKTLKLRAINSNPKKIYWASSRYGTFNRSEVAEKLAQALAQGRVGLPPKAVGAVGAAGKPGEG